MNFKEEWSIMKNFYITSALSAFTNLTQAIYVIYLIAIGFSTSGVGIILALNAFIIILFEVPTGVVADVFGRKISTFIGLFFNSFAILIFFLTTNQLWIIISIIIKGISFTFRSGAEQAWSIDYYEHYGKKKLLNRIISRMNSISAIVAIVALFISSTILLLFKESYGLISVARMMFLIEFLFMLISSIIALITKEPYFKKRKINSYFKSSIKEAKLIFKKSVRIVRSNKKLLFLLLAISLFTFGVTPIVSGWQIQFQNNNIDESFYSIIIGASSLINFIVISLNEKINKKMGSIYKTIIISVICFSIITILLSFNFGWFLIPLFWLLTVFSAILVINHSVYLNKLTPSKVRATIISFKSITNNISGMISQIILFGLFTDLVSINFSILIGGIITVTSLLLYKNIK